MSTVVTLLHFNLQYCAGGLPDLFPSYEATNDQLEDDIVEESFAPVLDVLDAHPGWTFDLELQGYMIEVLAERHPDVLDHLRTLAKSGQVELVSFHYSDQLWTAFPATDMVRSADLNRKIFEDADLPLSGVVFTQEGQFSEGMLAFMAERGWTTAVLPPNLGEYLWGGNAHQLYAQDGVSVLVGRQVDADLSFSFLNDGELWATNELNCYLGPAFVYDADATADRVAALEADEAAGATIGGIGAWVADHEAEAVALPPVVDGTWQPDDTDNLGLWMGEPGVLWADGEADDDVRVANTRSAQAALAAELAGGDADEVAAAWKDVLLGEVSDATGWNPYWTETQYGLDHAASGVAHAEAAVADLCEGAGALRVDLATGEVTPGGVLVDAVVPADPAADLPAVVTTGRTAALAWGREGESWVLDVTFAAGDEAPAVVFPWDAAAYETVPALGDELVRVDADSLAFSATTLPLSWGLARLDDTWFVVEDERTVHLGGRFDRAAGTLTFADETAAPAELHWRFALVPGSAALDRARAWNVEPAVLLDCPGEDVGPDTTFETCDGCSARGAGAAGWGIAVAAVLGARRRRSTDVRQGGERRVF